MATAEPPSIPGGIAMPMRDRLLGAVAAASPSSKGKMPLQLPPPPPGMPASQVEKWRKEVAKIVNKQQKEEMRLLKQREKEEDKIKREEEKMRAKVDKLAQKMLQQTAGTRRSQPETPLTQQWSPDGSPATSPRMQSLDPLAYHETAGHEAEQDRDCRGENEQVPETLSPKASASALHNDMKENNKENARQPNQAAAPVSIRSINAADEVSKALAARRERVEQAIKQKESIDAVADPKLRELACEREREELQSFERRIPNKKKLQEEAAERAMEAAEQREAKEVPGKRNSLLNDVNKKRQSVSGTIEQCVASQHTEPDPMETSFVIDEIPEPQAGDDAPPCGIGIMIAQNAAGQYVVVDMFPEGAAAKSGLISVHDVIELIDGQAVDGMQPASVGDMIRGRRGTQVVLDIFAMPNMRRARVGITRWPVDKDKQQVVQDSALAREEEEQQQAVPKHRRRKPQRQAPPPPPPAELSDYDAAYSALPEAEMPTERTAHTAESPRAAPGSASAVTQLPGVMICHPENSTRCGVGLGFEYQPNVLRGALVLRSMTDTDSPFALGDCLAQVNGTDVTSNAMLAPSLIFGDAGTSVHLKMTRGTSSIEATLTRKPSLEDGNLMTMSGGAKTCGIGVVLEIESNSQCFYVKRVVHGGPAFSAGVLQGDLVTHIDDADMRSFTKEQLPSLILGPEGSRLRMKLLRAGDTASRELTITRFLDTAKAQQSNLASSALLTFDYMESVGVPLETDKYACCLHEDIVSALFTVPKRIQVASLSLESGMANVYVLPDFEGSDTRSVEELVRDFVYQGSTQRSTLRQKPTCKSLSKIDVLGQVDPTQPKLDLDKLCSAPIMLKSTHALMHSAPPAPVAPTEQSDKQVGDCGGDAGQESTEKSGLEPEVVAVRHVQKMGLSGEVGLLAPKVLLCVVKASHTQEACHDDKNVSNNTSDCNIPEEVDASPVVSAVDNTQGETRMADQEPNAESAAPLVQPTDEESASAEEGCAAEEADEAGLELPIGRKLLACLGHPEASNAIDDSSSEEVPTTAGSASPPPGHEEASNPDQEEASPDHSRPLSPSSISSEADLPIAGGAELPETSAPLVENALLMSSVPESTDAGAGETIAMDAETADLERETYVSAAQPSAVRSKSLKLLSLPAEASSLAEESEARASAPAPPAVPETTLDTKEEQASVEAPVEGSALESVAALYPCDVRPSDHVSTEDGPILKEAESLIAEHERGIEPAGLPAIGGDAWGGGICSYVNDPAPVQVPCVPPRPSRAAAAASSLGEGVGEEAPNPACQASAVCEVTAHEKAGEQNPKISPGEMKDLHEKFPHRIPVIVTKAEYSIAPEIEGCKYLVPMNITAKNLHILISKRMDALPSGMRLVLSAAGLPLLGNGPNGIFEFYDTHHGKDGTLHLAYDVEEGELHSDNEESSGLPGTLSCDGERGSASSRSSSPVKMHSQGSSVMEMTASFADSAQGQLKNWINLDSSTVKCADGKSEEESISPLSLLIGFGNNLQQMAMPSAPEAKPPMSLQANGAKGSENMLESSGKGRLDDAANRPVVAAAPTTAASSTSASAPAPLAGVGLKIERDVGGRGFRIAGVAPDGPAAKTVVKVNDYLVAVDNVPVKDKNTTEAASLLKGPEGSRVQLHLRKGDKMHVVTLVRSAVLQGKIKEPDTRALAPMQQPKTDKVQIFGFSF